MAMPIENGRGHHFMEAAFAHSTSMAFTYSRKDDFVAWTNSDEVLIFAWVRAGGTPTAQAAETATDS